MCLNLKKNWNISFMILFKHTCLFSDFWAYFDLGTNEDFKIPVCARKGVFLLFHSKRYVRGLYLDYWEGESHSKNYICALLLKISWIGRRFASNLCSGLKSWYLSAWAYLISLIVMRWDMLLSPNKCLVTEWLRIVLGGIFCSRNLIGGGGKWIIVFF